MSTERGEGPVEPGELPGASALPHETPDTSDTAKSPIIDDGGRGLGSSTAAVSDGLVLGDGELLEEAELLEELLDDEADGLIEEVVPSGALAPPPAPMGESWSGPVDAPSSSTVPEILSVDLVSERIEVGPSGVVEEGPRARSPELSIEAALVELADRSVGALRAACERELARETEPSRRAALEHALGRLAEEAGDEEQARLAYGRALAAEPTLVPSRWALRRLLATRGDQAGELALIDAELEVSSAPGERAELLVERGRLRESQGELDAARAAYLSAVEANPSSLAAWMALDRLALTAEDEAARAMVLRGMVDATGDVGRKVELLVELVRSQAAEVRQATLAEAYALATETAPAPMASVEGRVLDELERSAAGRTEELVAVLERREELGRQRGVTMERVVGWRRRRAKLLRAEHLDGARATLEAALAETAEAAPERVLLLGDLMELAETEGRADQVADLAGRLADWHERAGDPATAVRLRFTRLRALWAAGRGEEAERWEAALGGAKGAVRDALLIEREERALRAGDLGALAACWRDEAERALASGARESAAQAFLVASALAEQRGEVEAALVDGRRALEAAPDEPTALDALDRLLARAGRHAERVPVLEALVAVAQPMNAARLLDELIDLRLDVLGDVDGAIAASVRRCALPPSAGGEVWARSRLAELYRDAGRHTELAAALDALASSLRASDEPGLACEALVERARIVERHGGDAKEALAILDEALCDAPWHPVARAEQRRLLAASERWDEVTASLYGELEAAELVGDEARAAPLLVELAQVYEERLGRPAEAAQARRELLERASGITPMLAAQARRNLDDSEQARAAAEWLAMRAASSDFALAAETRLRMAEVYEQAGDAARATAAFEQVRSDGDYAAHAALGSFRLAARAGDDARADERFAELACHADAATAAALAECEERIGEANGVARMKPERWRLLSSQLAASSDVRMRDAWAMRAALLAAAGGEGGRESFVPVEEPAQSPSMFVAPSRRSRMERIDALTASGRLAEVAVELQQGLELAPCDVVLLETTRRLARRVGDGRSEARAAFALAEVIAEGPEGEERACSLYRAAGERLEALGETLEAAVAWRALLRLRPTDELAFVRARDLLTRLNDPGALDELYTARLAAPSPPTRLLLDRAELRARTGRPRAAIEDYRTATDRDPSNVEAWERLARALHELGDRPGAVAALERRVALDGDGKLAALLRLADLHEAEGEARAAAQALERAALEMERVGDSPVGGSMDVAGVAAIELRRANLLRDVLDDQVGARGALDRALALAPLQTDALAALVELCPGPAEAAQRRRALERTAAAAQRALDADATNAEAYRLLARIAEWSGDADGAFLAAQAFAWVTNVTVTPRPRVAEPSGAWSDSLYEHAFTRGDERLRRSAASAIWHATHDAASQLLGSTAASLGIGRKTRQNERTTPQAWAAIDRLAQALGIKEYALHAVAGSGVCRAVDDALALSAEFAEQDAMCRHAVARQLVLLRERSASLDLAPDEDLMAFFAGCAQVAGAQWAGAERVTQPRRDEWAKSVARALDRGARKALQALAPRFDELGDVLAWRRAILAGAERLALALVGDLSAVPMSGVPRTEPTTAALARWVVSDELAALRRALGMRGAG